jgi:hypothetical protein
MTAVSGSFTGNVTAQTAMTIPDQPNHLLMTGQVAGRQNSADSNWNGAGLTYYGVTDVVGGSGTQRGYFINHHTDGDTDYGSFEGRVTSSGTDFLVEGTWQYTGGTGKFSGVSGKGTFNSRSNAAGMVEGSWQGAYEVARTSGAAG